MYSYGTGNPIFRSYYVIQGHSELSGIFKSRDIWPIYLRNCASINVQQHCVFLRRCCSKHLPVEWGYIILHTNWGSIRKRCCSVAKKNFPYSPGNDKQKGNVPRISGFFQNVICELKSRQRNNKERCSWCLCACNDSHCGTCQFDRF
jgi:hypothetical protein